jgi:multisubunit Na+/H+ antiporter MnhB subunit
MGRNITLKAGVGLAGGFVFWFVFVLVMIVYSFMPIYKLPRQVGFTVIWPLIYLGLANWVFVKIFKDKGWKNYLIHTLILILSALASLFILDWLVGLGDVF